MCVGLLPPSPTPAHQLGCDINEMLLSQPDTGEQALEIAEHL